MFKIILIFLLIILVIGLILQAWPIVLLLAILVGVFYYKSWKGTKETEEKKWQEHPRAGDSYESVLAYVRAFAIEEPRETKMMNGNPEISATMYWFDDDRYHVFFSFNDRRELERIDLMTSEKIFLADYCCIRDGNSEVICGECDLLPMLNRIVRNIKKRYGISFDRYTFPTTSFFNMEGSSDIFPASVSLVAELKTDTLNDAYVCHYSLMIYPRKKTMDEQ